MDQLGGGCISQVYRVVLTNEQILVAKHDPSQDAQLELEGFMLQYLAEQSTLPVPEVFHASAHLLLMAYIEGVNYFSPGAQEHAAELLAILHKISAHAYGFERDTLIGGLHQPNPWTKSWISFFRDQRLMYMANESVQAGRLPPSMYKRLGRFCEKLDIWLKEPEQPSLIHGDVWTTNILSDKDRIVGFIDPAIYFADPEIELAFTTLFGTFSSPFFSRYQEFRPLDKDFFDSRKDIYNLYPLLVHVRLFGGSYFQNVDSTLRRFGY